MKSIYDYIKEIITPGLVFVEIGGNAGDTAQKINNMILEIIQNYTYIVFEPDKRFWDALRRNERKYKKLKFINKAISNVNGKAILYISSGEAFGTSVGYQVFDNSSSIKKPTQKMFECWPKMKFRTTQIVDTIRLDDCGIDHIDFLWCDIQGAELEFIEGGYKTLKKTRFLYTEYNREEIYEGCPNLEIILELLPDWKVIEDYNGDVLLENKKCN